MLLQETSLRAPPKGSTKVHMTISISLLRGYNFAGKRYAWCFSTVLSSATNVRLLNQI